MSSVVKWLFISDKGGVRMLYDVIYMNRDEIGYVSMLKVRISLVRNLFDLTSRFYVRLDIFW